MWTRRLIAALTALALVATACGEDLADDGTTSGRRDDGVTTISLDPSEFSLTGGLATFNSCDALLTHLRTEGAERVGPYGFNDGGYWGPVFDIAIAEEAAVDVADADTAGGDDSADRTTSTVAASAPAGSDGGLVEGEDFSGTNVQEVGVDEPDIVKTDGNRILTLTNGVFTHVDANGGDPVRRGSINVGYDVNEMLIVGDRVLLFGMTYGEFDGPMPMPVDAVATDDVDVDFADDAEAEFAEETAPVRDILPPGPTRSGPGVRIVELDISNPDSIVRADELVVDGRYLSARLIDGQARVAIQSDPVQLPFVYPANENGEDRAEEANREIVMETELSDWLPGYTIDSGGEGQLTDCGDVHAPLEFAGFGSLSVLTIDMTRPLAAPEATSVLAAGDTVYASTDTMWLATNRWFNWGILDGDGRREAEESFSTDLHGFDITGDRAEYLASGTVRGHLLNQFAMSQHDGVLRVASTDGTIWGATDESESYVTTFEVDDRELRQLGQVGNMGKGERIFAVRFVGDIAYVVTFRQTDPFYTVDLADPANPRVLGELKITGYSGQLHPLTDTLVLGIGQEATEEGRTTGAKVTLFDVSDLANPTDLDTWVLPGGWTDAEFDHKAFLWWGPEQLAVLPIQSWETQFWGAVALRVDTEAGTLTEAGRISHEPAQGQDIGSTACEVLPLDELLEYRDTGSFLGELSWEAEFIIGDGGQVQVCGEGQTGAVGLYCDVWWKELSEDELSGRTGSLEVCWPEGPGTDPIVRTFVTPDTLWSMSWSRLQANDLQELSAGPFVSIN